MGYKILAIILLSMFTASAQSAEGAKKHYTIDFQYVDHDGWDTTLNWEEFKNTIRDNSKSDYRLLSCLVEFGRQMKEDQQLINLMERYSLSDPNETNFVFKVDLEEGYLIGDSVFNSISLLEGNHRLGYAQSKEYIDTYSRNNRAMFVKQFCESDDYIADSTDDFYDEVKDNLEKLFTTRELKTSTVFNKSHTPGNEAEQTPSIAINAKTAASGFANVSAKNKAQVFPTLNAQ